MISLTNIKAGMIPAVAGIYRLQGDDRRRNRKDKKHEGRRFADVLAYVTAKGAAGHLEVRA